MYIRCMPIPPTARRRALLLLLCVSAPSFMVNLDANIVAVSLPAIARALHADFSQLEWVVSAYTLTFAALVLAAGTVADRFGRKRTLIAGVLLFGAASGACGAARSMGVLVAARAVQGIGAALQLSAALAILSHAFQGRERARAFAFWGVVVGSAVALGPLLGGLVTQTLGWKWAFYLNLPVVVFVLAIAAIAVEESRDTRAARLDLWGVVSFSAALFLLTLALISGNRLGWGSRDVQRELVAALALLIIFLVLESRSARPMLDLSWFKHPTFVGANVAALALAASLSTMLTYVPVYFEGVLGKAPRAAGLLMLPMVMPVVIVPRVASVHLSHRYSGRALLTLGLSLVSVGLLWMGLMAERIALLPMLGGMLITGAGGGLLNIETAKVGMTVIPAERAGMASGIVGTVRFAGIATGFAALGAVLFQTVSTRLGAALLGALPASRAEILQHVVTGDLSVFDRARGAGVLHQAAIASLASGFHVILLIASGFAGIAAAAAWMLVRSADTAPVCRGAVNDEALAEVIEHSSL
jgi:EmrB/QacA subfamily drug resistance transporter